MPHVIENGVDDLGRSYFLGDALSRLVRCTWSTLAVTLASGREYFLGEIYVSSISIFSARRFAGRYIHSTSPSFLKATFLYVTSSGRVGASAALRDLTRGDFNWRDAAVHKPLRVIIEDEGVVIFSPSGRFLEVNKGFAVVVVSVGVESGSVRE